MLHESVHDDVVQRIAKAYKQIRIGDPWDRKFSRASWVSITHNGMDSLYLYAQEQFFFFAQICMCMCVYKKKIAFGIFSTKYFFFFFFFFFFCEVQITRGINRSVIV